MFQTPKDGPVGKTVRLIRKLSALRIPLHAAGAGYFMILSMFPGLVVLLSLLRRTGLRVESLVELIRGWLPDALMPAAEAVIVSAYENASGSLLGLSAVAAIWSAGRGVWGILTGLNAVYGVEESRGWLRTRLISAAYTFAFLLVLLLTLVLQVFGDTVLKLLAGRPGGLARFLTEAVDLRFVLLVILQTGIFALMFRVLPNRRGGFRESLPGALLASFGWLAFSDLYSVYVDHFAGLRSVYGSVYAIALSMLWLYCCMSIVFYGGALNRFLWQS